MTEADSKTERLIRAACNRVDGASLAVFRIVFGLGVAVYAIKGLVRGEVRMIFVDPEFHFSYWGFEWLKPWPGSGMYLHFAALAISGLLVAAGIAYRFSSIVLALLFSFVFLSDRTAYLNHYYLMVLLCWMMTVLPADRVFSVDRIGQSGGSTRGTTGEAQVPHWAVWLVQFHIGVPYFFGGVAKLSADWLQGQPMRMTLMQQPLVASVAEVVGTDPVVYLFAVGGMLFDLAVVPALLWRPTRNVAFCLTLGFHLTNALVFPIGVFPWLMMGATTIFFEPDWPRRLLRLQPVTPAAVEICVSRRQRIMLGMVGCYLAFHCLLPLRHLVTAGDPNWTERGHFFAWHMMLRGKRCGLRMYVTDPETGRTAPVDLRNFVTEYQFPKVGRDPEHIRQLAHMIAASVEQKRNRRVEVRAFALVSLNGRKAELLVDPTVDLASQPATWTLPAWINELHEPLLKQHWDVPLLEWEEALGMDAEAMVRVRPAEASDVRGKRTSTDTVTAGLGAMTFLHSRK